MMEDESIETEGQGRLYLIATPIGNLEDLSHRATRLLAEVDIIAAEDTRRTKFLLNHFSVTAREIVSLFEGNEAMRTEQLVARLEEGASVAVVTDAGTPSVSDPGQRLAAAAGAKGISVFAIPGASAPLVALVASGLPSTEFRFSGFPPRTRGERLEWLGRLRGETATMIFFEAPGRVAATAADMAEVFGGERRCVLGRELTKLHEEHVRGNLQELAQRYAETAPRGECTLVVEGATETVAEVDVEAELRILLAEGLGPKQAAQRLVLKTGLSRRKLYQLALSLQPPR